MVIRFVLGLQAMDPMSIFDMGPLSWTLSSPSTGARGCLQPSAGTSSGGARARGVL